MPLFEHKFERVSPSSVGAPPRSAARVAPGRSTAVSVQGYRGSLRPAATRPFGAGSVSTYSDGRGAMTTAMSEQVDARPCDVLRGGDGPVYFLLDGRLYVVHEVLGRWIEADGEPDQADAPHPASVEHWLVTASIGRFGTPAVFRLQRRPAPPANGPDRWTVRAERR